MLRVRTIYVGAATAAAEYYTRYLAQAPGEAPGVWHGAQATGLGLTGEVNAEQLLSVLEGRHPDTGVSLGRQLRDRTLADGTVVKAVAGFDTTFSAPKSLSVLWALTRDDRMLDAHDVAVRAALAHLERFGATTRVRTSGGRRLHPDSQGLTIATFRQTTSRADDPQIHTHCVVSAKVQTDDGRWMALDARYLKKYQRVIGGLYQSVLRNELTHRFGIAWGAIEHGQAEMTAMPADLLAAFSKRTDQIDDALAAKIADFTERSGRDPNQWELGALKREAAVDTRAHKTGNGVADLTTRWDTEAASLGWSGRDLVEVFDTQGVDREARPPAISVDSLIDSLSAAGSTWSRAQIIGALADVARPDPSLSGEQWAARLESWADAVAERCTNSTQSPTMRRGGGATVARCGANRYRRISPPKPSSPRRRRSSRGRSPLKPTMSSRRSPCRSTASTLCKPTSLARSPAMTGSCLSSALPARARPPRCGQRSTTSTNKVGTCSAWRPRPRLPVSSKRRPAPCPTPWPSCCTSGTAPTVDRCRSSDSRRAPP
jgi:conjugative relaxase-like TrwC/TraI family protein